MNEDPAIREEIAQFPEGDEQATLRRFIDLAGRNGFAFTDTEIDGVFLALAVEEAREAGQELSVEELEMVAGGATGSYFQCFPRSVATDLSVKIEASKAMESRSFQTLSTVMRTKHDTAKSAINNVR